jgi:hypothetical protein
LTFHCRGRSMVTWTDHRQRRRPGQLGSHHMTTDQSAAAAALDALASRLAGLGLGAGVDDRQAVLPDPLRGFHRRLLGATT